MKNNNNGFTLIELMAVILILGIIALIAIPNVNKVLSDAKEGAFKVSIKNISKKVQETCNMEMIEGNEITLKYVIKDGIAKPKLALKGELPDGQITVDNDCLISYKLTNNQYTSYKIGPKEEQIISKGHNTIPKEVVIKKSTEINKSYVGYYADIEADGVIDGIIFADLITGNVGDGQWRNEYGNYEIPKINSDDSKDYYITMKSYDSYFGDMPVVSLDKNSKGSDRFYILSLEDYLKDKSFYWYSYPLVNMNDYASTTSSLFGTGKKNTSNMLKKWNNSEYGEQTDWDIWGEITEPVNNGWFVPSSGEWSAFIGEVGERIGMDRINFPDYGMHFFYWTSTQNDDIHAFSVRFHDDCILGKLKHYSYRLRLAKTF